MVFELEEETGRGHPPGPSLCACVRPPEQRGESLGYHPSTLTISSPETSGDLAVAAAREGDDTLVVLAQERVAEPWHALCPGQVRARDETAQAPIATGIARHEDQMRTALADADATQVFPDGLPVARETGALGSRATRRSFMRCLAVGLGEAKAANSPPFRGDQPGRVWFGCIQQLDLQTDHRMETGLLRR